MRTAGVAARRIGRGNRVCRLVVRLGSALRLVKRLAADRQHNFLDHHADHGFFIQNTQRRDTQAIQLKLDELIRVNSEARNELISLEAKPETAVDEIREAFDELREEVEDEVRPRGRR